MTKQPNALILGAAGFIGRHTARALAAKGCNVIGVGHGGWSTGEARTFGLDRWINADITLDTLNCLDLPEYIDCVVHCAGSGAVSYSYVDPWSDFQRATVTTAAVLDWMRRKSYASRLVLVSSAAVYGDHGDTDIIETSSRSPISPYGFHKLAAELLSESSSRFFDIPISIVRLFSVYGEGLRKQLLWDAMKKFSSGQNEFFGTGNEIRDWLHVNDAAELLTAAALMPQSRFEIFNGGNEHATVEHVLRQLAASSCSDMSPSFTGAVHTGNPPRLTADCSYAKSVLNWTPKINLQDGLSRYTAWFEASRKS